MQGSHERNLPLAAGMLLLSAAILLGEAGLVPHGLKLLMMGLACAIELWGAFRQCRKRKEGES